MIKIKRRPLTEDALVADAVQAKSIDPVQTREEMVAAWKDFPGPSEKPKACSDCGHAFIRRCTTPAGCDHFKSAQRQRNKGVPKL